MAEKNLAKHADKSVAHRFNVASDWFRDQTGLDIDPRHIQAVIQVWGDFQKSDENKQAKADDQAAKSEAAAAEKQRKAEAREAKRVKAKKSDEGDNGNEDNDNEDEPVKAGAEAPF